MRSRRNVALWIACALALLGLTGVFVFLGGPSIVAYSIANPQKDGFSFHFEQCNDPRVTQDNSLRPEWDASGTLLVSAIADANCGTSWMFGDYSIRSNTVILEYQAIVPLYAMCDCPHKVTYRVAGLPKTNYRVELLARPEIYAMWTLPWFVLGMAVIVLAAALAPAGLWAGRTAGGTASSEIEKSARKRKAITVLGALLIVSLVAYIVFLFVAGSTNMSVVNGYAGESIVGYVYTMWILLWLVLGAALIVLAATFAVASLRARQSARGVGSAELDEAARGRKVIKLLGVLLIISVGINIVFSFLAGSAYMSALSNAHVGETIVGYLGKRAGREQADRDFTSGTIRWYQFSDVESVPPDRSTRELATMDVGGPPLLHWYRKEFIKHYNSRIDELAPPAKHPKPRRR